MQIAVLEGYRVPRRKKMACRRGSMRSKMKACARHHKVTSKGFWRCVRGGHKRRRHRR